MREKYSFPSFRVSQQHDDIVYTAQQNSPYSSSLSGLRVKCMACVTRVSFSSPFLRYRSPNSCLPRTGDGNSYRSTKKNVSAVRIFYRENRQKREFSLILRIRLCWGDFEKNAFRANSLYLVHSSKWTWKSELKGHFRILLAVFAQRAVLPDLVGILWKT